jgi:Holliday junction resolvasome RuvABC ATP-dependent DNA helicase subunit
MASTRTTTQKRRSAQTAAPQAPKQALGALARHAAHLQIAACTAAANTLARWAQSTDRFAQAVADELLRRVGETDSAEMVARVTAASGTHLRELSALPRAAADHFDMRLARVSIDHKEVR